jgi:hypothetical protein
LYSFLASGGGDPDELAGAFWEGLGEETRNRYLETAVAMAKFPAEFPNPEDVTNVVRSSQYWEDELMDDQASGTWEALQESLEEASSQDGSILNERWQRLAGIDVL